MFISLVHPPSPSGQEVVQEHLFLEEAEAMVMIQQGMQMLKTTIREYQEHRPQGQGADHHPSHREVIPGTGKVTSSKTVSDCF